MRTGTDTDRKSKKLPVKQIQIKNPCVEHVFFERRKEKDED